MNKKSLLTLIGTGLSLLMLLHSLWQIDLIAVGPVWGSTLGNSQWYFSLYKDGFLRLADKSFQCGFWFRTTVGNAYDLYLGMAVVSWFVLLVSLFYLFYNERQKANKLKKEILYLKEINRISMCEGE